MLNIDTIRNHYKTLSERYEQEPLAVSWGNDNERNQLRYQTVVSKILFKEEPVSILDVGSGHGEILKYFPSDNFSYTGIDFVDNSISKGQAAHDNKHEFIHGDFETYEFNKSFDNVLCVGIFNYKGENSLQDIQQLMYSFIIKMFTLCRHRVILNLISAKVNYYHESMFYKSPVELLSWCLDNITSQVDLDHSSLPYEFFLTLKK